jgi:hypothetical protein
MADEKLRMPLEDRRLTGRGSKSASGQDQLVALAAIDVEDMAGDV